MSDFAFTDRTPPAAELPGWLRRAFDRLVAVRQARADRELYTYLVSRNDVYLAAADRFRANANPLDRKH